MPESPEVRAIATWLRSRVFGKGLKGATLKEIESHDDKIDLQTQRSVISDVVVYGKRLAFVFENAPWLQVHLRMTGDFVVNAAKARVTLRTSAGDLAFVDPRRFGTFEYIEAKALERKLGPDTFESARGALDPVASSARSLKAVLLDQNVLAGLGNIWVDEALFAAELLPQRKMNTLSERDRRRLESSSTHVIRKAYDTLCKGFSDESHGISWSKRAGEPSGPKEALIHGVDTCPQCQRTVSKEKVAGRSTWFCDHCQA